jgi:hypothetical protein
MYGSDGIAIFQFHQTAVDEIILSIVPGPGSRQSREEKIQESIRQIQSLSPGQPVRVEIREVDAIPLSTAGKHRFTRSDVNATGAAAQSETTAEMSS